MTVAEANFVKRAEVRKMMRNIYHRHVAKPSNVRPHTFIWKYCSILPNLLQHAALSLFFFKTEIFIGASHSSQKDFSLGEFVLRLLWHKIHFVKRGNNTFLSAFPLFTKCILRHIQAYLSNAFITMSPPWNTTSLNILIPAFIQWIEGVRHKVCPLQWPPLVT